MGFMGPNLKEDQRRVVVRHFEADKDLKEVDEVERRCEAGPSGSISLFADLLGDPLCRVRHFPAYCMLVAEIDKEIVGMIRAGVKEVVCGKTTALLPCGAKVAEVPAYAKVGYILGLRVSPFHRRMGIGLKLAMKAEEWCRNEGAQYAYMATEKDNAASLNLFTEKLGYKRIRTPSILVHPVFQHGESIPPNVILRQLGVEDAIALYKSVMGMLHFFPKDIESVMGSDLYEGTWVATLEGGGEKGLGDGMEGKSWAVLSIWKCNQIFKLQVEGVSWKTRALAAFSRFLDRSLPWLKLASFPNLFRPFGMQFLFGLHAQGDKGSFLINTLCRHARNIARAHKCQVVMTELGSGDPLLQSIPHWKIMSADEDLWCVKRLNSSKFEDARNWLHSSEDSVLFVDPRDV